ncbi:hypothetical protein [Mycolicibacterium sp. CH28]|uniref:hypothetical protein n=1 Tax=Mycolicibacterium sp. CH28 TaxID=2512237 RepID=UPI0019141A65|nr:hypothetical protein [Mycolicibacterium sp. CH28]
MKKSALTALIASGLAATVLGLASPAHADTGHNWWVNHEVGQSASVPHVSTSVQQSR